MKKYFLAFLILLITSTGFAANHYVRAGASGSANGSDWTNACTDFTGSCAASSLTRGDTYYVADGAYTGRTFSTAASGTSLITIKKATVADHGTATGWSDAYGDGQAAWSGTVAFTTNYWTFDGVSGGGPGNWTGPYGFKVTNAGDGAQVIQTGSGATNITIKHAEVVGANYESTNDGFGVDGGGTNLLVSYVWIHDVGRCPIARPVTNGVSIWEYLYVSSYWARGTIHGEIISAMYPNGNQGDTTFRYSLFTDVESTGGLMWDNRAATGSHLYVYGNVFYKDPVNEWNYGNGVISGWTGGSNELFSNVHVYNNTFINIPGNVFGVYYGVGKYDSTNNEVYNNVFYNSTSPSYTNTYQDSGEIWNVHNYNHYINSGGSHSEANGTSAASGDPFANYAAFDFSLTGATTAGYTLSSPYNLDPNAITRGADGLWDRGAYEYGGADTTPPVRSSGSPSGELSYGTTSTTMSLTTNEAATCKYGTSDVSYASLPSTFSTTGGTSHAQALFGLTNGSSYTYYIRCQDSVPNANTNGYSISFSVAASGGGGGGSLVPTFPPGLTISGGVTIQ